IFSEASECIDTDDDGTPDYLDTDSDDDGCSDAFEAGATTDTTIDYVFPSTDANWDTNGDGLADIVDTANGSPLDGALGYTSIYSTYATDDTKSVCDVDLSLTKIVDKTIPKLGEEIIFTIKVTNNSPFSVTGVQVIDVLPTGLTYVETSSDIPDNTTYVGSTGIWDLSSLTIASSGTVELKIAATVTEIGSILTNKAEIYSLPLKDKDSTPNNNN
ncbi:DUF11 domain-containing protein, partial [uncultured Polaribacter sp.]|uniref:DUF11 domain-containing protein n=1 Tax=uncultured Polaribacter sp. TaxID=174711 RepID=UPI0026213443